MYVLADGVPDGDLGNPDAQFPLSALTPQRNMGTTSNTLTDHMYSSRIRAAVVVGILGYLSKYRGKPCSRVLARPSRLTRLTDGLDLALEGL